MSDEQILEVLRHVAEKGQVGRVSSKTILPTDILGDLVDDGLLKANTRWKALEGEENFLGVRITLKGREYLKAQLRDQALASTGELSRTSGQDSPPRTGLVQWLREHRNQIRVSLIAGLILLLVGKFI